MDRQNGRLPIWTLHLTSSFVVGPNTWAVKYPLAAGDGQSPIDIVPEEATFDSELPSHPIQISYVPENSFEIENTGESFKVKISQKSGNIIFT